MIISKKRQYQDTASILAMLAALFRIHFPLTAGGMVAPPQPRLDPRAPDVQQLNQDKPR
jgi:hypothetical protein